MKISGEATGMCNVVVDLSESQIRSLIVDLVGMLEGYGAEIFVGDTTIEISKVKNKTIWSGSGRLRLHPRKKD